MHNRKFILSLGLFIILAVFGLATNGQTEDESTPADGSEWVVELDDGSTLEYIVHEGKIIGKVVTDPQGRRISFGLIFDDGSRVEINTSYDESGNVIGETFDQFDADGNLVSSEDMPLVEETTSEAASEEYKENPPDDEDTPDDEDIPGDKTKVKTQGPAFSPDDSYLPEKDSSGSGDDNSILLSASFLPAEMYSAAAPESASRGGEPMRASSGSDPTPQDCADINGDKFVDLFDYAELADYWLDTGPDLPGDFNRTNSVDLYDLAYLIDYWLENPQCFDYYADSLPYLTSFESYQGYFANYPNESPDNWYYLDYQKGWRVDEGEGLVKWTRYYPDPCEPEWVPYQYAYVDENSVVGKSFNDEGTDHKYIRFNVVPAYEAEIMIMNGSTAVAGIKFADDWDVHVWTEPNSLYFDTGVNYYDRWYNSYWTEIKLEVDWSGDSYKVYWNNEPNVIAHRPLDPNTDVLTDIKFLTSDDWLAVNRLSISDFADGDLFIDITSPCACDDDLDLKGRIPIEGTAWGENFGVYELYFCPTDLDIYDFDNWYRFDTGSQVVDDGILGYWDTSSIPNGYYHIGAVIYNDLGYSSNGLEVIFKEIWVGETKLYEGPGYFPVTGDLKSNTFYHEEKPDISVSWPGQFPFELKRIYNNNRRFYAKPIRNGWTHNNHIILEEDSQYFYESDEGFPSPDIYHDNNLLGFGYIFITYPDGSKQMYRRSSSGDTGGSTAEYVPYPKNGKTEVLTRRSYVNDSDEIYRVTYTLKTRDGTTLDFRHDFNPKIWIWQNGGYGIIGWKAIAPVNSMSDRFGNTLSVSWKSDKTAVTQVSYGSGATAKKIKFYDDNSDGYYEEARLIVGTNEDDPLRMVTFDWDGNDKIFTVTNFNEGVDENGVYISDANDVSPVTLYQYDSEWNMTKIAYGDDINEPTIEVGYDNRGRTAGRKDYVNSGNYLETNYTYSYYHPLESDIYTPDPEQTGEDNLYLKTIQTTAYQSAVVVQNPNGALAARKITPVDGSESKEILLEYEDSANPLKPTEAKKYFDSFIRRTVNTYNSYGDLTVQKVYDEQNKPVRTEMEYHPDYSLMTRRITWQEPNVPVETVYVYGKNDGTIDQGNSKNNKYLIGQEVLTNLDPEHPTDPNYAEWAVAGYEYVANGLVTEKVDPNGFRTIYEYDDNDYRRWVKVGPDGSEQKVQRFYHDEIGQIRLAANHLGGVTLYDYDGFGRVYRVRTYEDADAFTIDDNTFVPSRYEGMTTLSITNYGYDDRGNRTYEKKPDTGQTTGGKITTTYNLANQPDLITYYNYDDGVSTYVEVASVDYSYDGRGLKIQEFKTDQINSLDWKVAYDYDDLGRLIDTWWYDYDDTTIIRQVSSGYYGSDKKKYAKVYGLEGSLESHTEFTYDIFDRLTEQVVDPNDLALTTTYSYDDVGNRISMVDPKGSIIYFDYDNANRQTVTYFAAESGTEKNNCTIKQIIGYHPNNSPARITSYDYDGSTVLACSQFTHDDRGRLIKVVQDIDASSQAVTQYDYSDTGFGPGNAYHIKIADAENKLTWRALDAFGRIAKILYPSGDYQEAEFNGDGTVKRRAAFDPNDIKHWIDYTYDGHGRLAEVKYPDNGTVTNSYDGFGRKILVEDDRNSSDNIGGNGQIAYEYDVFGRIACLTEQDGYEIEYSYWADGQKQTVAVKNPSDQEIYNVFYTYDAANRLAGITEPPLGIDGFVADFDYDANGNRSLAQYYRTGNGFGPTVDIDYDYNRDNLLTDFSTTGGPTFSFDASDSGDIDGLGRLVNADETLTKTDSGTISHTLDYSYDRLSRLAYAKTSNVPPMSYVEYSHTHDDAGNITSLTFDDGTGGQTANYTFDGDLVTGDGANSVTWDENGRQTSQLSSDPNDYILDYDWDSRLRKGQYGDPNNYMEAVYAPDGARIAKKRIWSDSSDYNHKYIVDVVGDVPVVLLVLDADNSNAILKTYIHANGQVLMQHDGDINAARYLYLHDRLGSVRQVINSSGNVVNCYTYDPWGLTVGSETNETVDNLYRFANYSWDAEVNQYHCFRRQYDPILFRFTSRDPILGGFKEPLTLHAYLYCLNDPVNGIDPTGEFSYTELKASVAIGAGYIGTAGAAFARRGLSLAQNLIRGINFSTRLRSLWIRTSEGGRQARDSASRIFNNIARWLQSGSGVGQCFVAGTEICTPDGSMPIEKMSGGTEVYGWDENTGETVISKVVRTFQSETENVVIIQVASSKIVTTPEHPFYVEGHGWTRAKYLDVGHRLLSQDENFISIKEITLEERNEIVYNIEVDGCHNYYVSKAKILAHNKAQWNPSWATRNIFRVYDSLAKNHGISREVASARLHAIKHAFKLPANYDLVFDLTGNVYSKSGQLLGSLTQPGGVLP